jgi:hypothetical protein
MKRQRQIGITATGLMLINDSGITLAGMKFQRARLTRIQLNSVIIWLVSLVDRIAFLVVHMRWGALCVFLFIVSMVGNFIDNVFLVIQLRC